MYIICSFYLLFMNKYTSFNAHIYMMYVTLNQSHRENVKWMTKRPITDSILILNVKSICKDCSLGEADFVYFFFVKWDA